MNWQERLAYAWRIIAFVLICGVLLSSPILCLLAFFGGRW